MKAMNKFKEYIDTNCDYKLVSNNEQYNIKDCPFCGNDKWKVYIGVKNRLGDCKVCGNTFNQYQFVAQCENTTPQQAYKLLQGEEIYRYEQLEVEKIPEFQYEYEVLLPACEKVYDNKYLIERGCNKEIIDYFNLLVASRGQYAGRIIIPIYHLDNSLVSFQARDYTGEAEQRYLFPYGFNSKKMLYNCHHISKNPLSIILTEGVFDAIGWHKAGFTSVVSTFGKHISEEQIDMLRYINPKTVYFAWDSGTIPEAIQMYKEYNHYFDFKFILMPSQDADELLVKELDDLFINAIDFDELKLIAHHLKYLEKNA
jgi:DNA primase